MDTVLVTLIGDVVDSKRHRDRSGLQRSLRRVIASVNGHLEPVQPLEVTVGDEFQGAFSCVSEAARASLLLRLGLLVAAEGSDSRFGLGHGVVTVFDERISPTSQDGPGWWAARDAIERAKAAADSPRTSFTRTEFATWQDGGGMVGQDVAAVASFLYCRDAIVEQMNQRARRLLLGLLLGRTQAELAESEGITQGAVSQNLRRSGAYAIVASQARLEDGSR